MHKLIPLSFVLFIAFYLCVFFATSFADTVPAYYDRHAEGWFWYHDFSHKTHALKKTTTVLPLSAQLEATKKLTDPIQRVAAISHVLLEARDQMTLNPNLPNIQFYLNLQNQVSQQASTLRENWQALLLNQPGMNFNLSHPTSAWANVASQQLQNQNNLAAIQNFSKSYGLLFFYRGSCPHCRHFAPVLADFMQRDHIAIIPISLDGLALPEFPNSRSDQGQALRLHVNEVPALFAVNPATLQVISLGAGDRTEDQLQNDILTAIRYAQKTPANPEINTSQRSVME